MVEGDVGLNGGNRWGVSTRVGTVMENIDVNNKKGARVNDT